MHNDTYITVAGLKARGWTDTLIRDLLGEPDDTRRNPHYASAAPTRLYLRERALAVEQSEDWAARMQKASDRRAAAGKAAQTKRERLLAYVEGLSIDVPVIPLDEATRSACENYNDRGGYGFGSATLGSGPPFLQRITVNYLRHRVSRYEEELERLFGKVGRHPAYRSLNRKVYAAIASSYPELADECRRQAEGKGAHASQPSV